MDQDWEVVNRKGTVVYGLLFLDFINNKNHINIIRIQAIQDLIKHLISDVFFFKFKVYLLNILFYSEIHYSMEVNAVWFADLKLRDSY